MNEGNAHDQPLTPATARAAVAELFDRPNSCAVGVEIELLTYSAADRRARPTLDQISAAVTSPLPAGGALTIEPGGQVELSTLPFADDSALTRAISDDLAALRARLAETDVHVDGAAIDMERPPQRIRSDARYRLMEEHFDRSGPAGRWMMNNTASTQLNVSMPGSTTRAWRLLHAIGPLLTAAFANSPGRCADHTSWASLRQGCWLHIDRTRTAAPGPGIDPIEEYWQYLMASHVFVMPHADGAIGAPQGLTMGAWIHQGIAGRQATLADLRYHLTTLFPPVRPRGWFELRMIDAVPETDLPAVVAIGMSLLDEPTVEELIAREIACPGGEFDAARDGLSAAPIHAATTELFGVIAEGLRHSGKRAASATVESYGDRVIGPIAHSPCPDVAGRWRPSWSDVTMTKSSERCSVSPRTGEAACAEDREVAHVPVR